ncbi:MAG TPA: hypothetical protein DCY20_06180 [Firmicutes bacterium]|nr:hypothetical protein [Bacillota bacterium]
MSKYFYDLHIHSILSPCADEFMTPNNIVNMAKLKGLDIIAVTDHNSSKQIEVIVKLCNEMGLLCIPGVEVESIEGVHLLCYFQNVERLGLMTQKIDEYLPNISNHETLFGFQVVMNEYDEVIEKVDKLLIQSTHLSIEEIISLAHELDGVVFAAHVNKTSHNILVNLGFIPEGLQLDGVELNHFIYTNQKEEIPDQINPFPILINSDAHSLGDINEAIYSIELPFKSAKHFIAVFKEE